MGFKSGTLLPGIQKVYETCGTDVEFPALLSSSDIRDDAVLAELIETDGRIRIARGKPVDLQRYLASIPDLRQRPDPLDAALDVALRSLAGTSRSSPHAIDQLVSRHPEFEHPIREAAALNAAVWSTTGLRERVVPPPPKMMPCEFGPLLSSGEHRYELQRLLGQGAFGQVYLARDRQLSEEGHTALVAIKILVGGHRTSWDRQRVIEEATKVRRINHGNVVLVLDRGVSDEDEDFIVYEYVDGGDLSETAGRGDMAVRDAARLVAKIARGAHAAHSAGVIHCDLKPGNIMLTTAGEPKVADFGIAVRRADVHKASSDEERSRNGPDRGPIGNLAFVSPEQFRGEEGALSVQSDVYALGGILYLVLTGILPNGSTLEEIANNHNPDSGRTTPPFVRPCRAEVDRDLEAICRRALAPRPEDRYSSAAALSEDLERWLDQEPITWTKPSILHVLTLWARRKPALAASVAFILLLLIIAPATILHFWSRAQLEAIRISNNNRFMGVLKSMKSKENRLPTELLTVIWALEYAYGPKVLDVPDSKSQLWSMRVDNIRSLVQTAREQGHGDDMETLLWESALGFWLVCADDYAEAEPLLDENIQHWTQRLAADDDWLSALHAIRHCASANRAAAKPGDPIAQPEALRALESTLVGDEQIIGERHAGTPVYFLVVKSRIKLYDPALLNQPERRDDLNKQLQALIDNTALKSTGKIKEVNEGPKHDTPDPAPSEAPK